jgi:hypothetical protein
MMPGFQLNENYGWAPIFNPNMDLMIAKVFRVNINLKTKTFLTQFLIISQHLLEPTIRVASLHIDQLLVGMCIILFVKI